MKPTRYLLTVGHRSEPDYPKCAIQTNDSIGGQINAFESEAMHLAHRTASEPEVSRVQFNRFFKFFHRQRRILDGPSTDYADDTDDNFRVCTEREFSQFASLINKGWEP